MTTSLWRFDQRTLKRAVADATESAIRQHQLRSTERAALTDLAMRASSAAMAGQSLAGAGLLERASQEAGQPPRLAAALHELASAFVTFDHR